MFSTVKHDVTMATIVVTTVALCDRALLALCDRVLLALCDRVLLALCNRALLHLLSLLQQYTRNVSVQINFLPWQLDVHPRSTTV